MRPLLLHARGRRAGPIACGLTAVAAAGWLLAALVDDAALLVSVLVPLAAVSLVGFALAGDDPALERTLPQRWVRRRAAELVVCVIAAGAVLLPAILEADGHAAAALRNVVALTGLACLGATALGARLAWLSPTCWAIPASAAGRGSEGWREAIAWPAQPGDATAALVLASGLAVAGAALYAWRGPATASPAG